MSLTKVTYSMIKGAPALATDFGVDSTGATNTTDQLKAFFDYCIATGSPGRIPAGTYLITLGQLAFDNNHVDRLFPQIETDGYFAVKFKAAANIDAPFISITNGTATSGAGKYWRGGGIGGISFEPASGITAGLTNMHGLLLRGLQSVNFGYIRGTNLGGSTIHIQQRLFSGNNPDPYHVASCFFEGVEGVQNGGAAFYNNNWVGFTGCNIKFIRAIENSNGVFFGMGAGNRVDAISSGSCAGWAIGDQSVVTGGASSRFSLGIAEFDDIQYGIDTSICNTCDFGSVRFVHRYNFGPLNPSGGYWPRIALKIGSPTRSVFGLNFQVVDRIEAGGAKINIGVFADFTNAAGNLNQTTIQRVVQDNAGLGFVASDFFINFNSNSVVDYLVGNDPVISSAKRNQSFVKARAPTTYALPNGGYNTGVNTVAYSTQILGRTAIYNALAYEYTSPGSGLYSISAGLILALPAGSRVRMGIVVNGVILNSNFSYAVTANAELHVVKTILSLNAGDIVKIDADQNSGAPVNLSIFGSPNDNYFIVEQITP